MENNERNRMIEDNMNLVYYLVRKYFYNNEDYYDVGMIGLIKGVDSYDKSRGSLCTYLGKCIYNEILMTHRNDKNPKKYLSLDYEESRLSNLITDSIDMEEQLIVKEKETLLYESVEKLNPFEKFIIVKYYGLYNNDKLSQREIANILNIRPSGVCKKHLSALKKLKKYMEDRNV